MSTIKHSHTFQINQNIDVLFPLFSAEGEKLWVPGWDYEQVMEGTELHEDYIFLTEAHDYASTKAIWLVKKFEPESHLVQFYKVEPEDKVAIITVDCTEISSKQTLVEVSYEYVGLSSKGNAFVAHYTSEKYKSYIDEWEQLLISYFESKTDE
ncbi:hypothetical protein [Candidatus Leptofilum sp.]|uniref:hypothetical protein n=1 Tax=Candidatus Leptofilum sp. TaxID=3241576 RepID=UPI003B5C1051